MNPFDVTGFLGSAGLIGLVLLIWGYGEARSEPLWLWIPPVWSRHAAALLMLPSFVLLAASLLLWMFSLTAQADCAVLGPGEDPCAGPVLGPTVCECP